MNSCFKYIIIIIILSWIIYLLINNPNKSDGFKNYLDIDETINKQIQEEIKEIKKDKEKLKNSKIIPKHLLNYHYKDKPRTIQRGMKQIYYKPLNKTLKDSEYSRYERILPKEYQVQQIKYAHKFDKVEDPGMKKTIDEKEDREKLFDPEKSCKGEWSDWNTNHCGDNSNRCSIKYRTFKIIKPEEKGGDSCKYKDNEKQYDYCYGRNHVERCGQHINLCDCKLDKSNKNMDNCSVNSYKDCRCLPGYTFNDVDVTNFVKNAGILTENDNEQRNRIGYDKTHTLKKGSCRKNQCNCLNGTPDDNCNTDGSESCKKCNADYILEGDPPKCNKVRKYNCPYGEGILRPAGEDINDNKIQCNLCEDGYIIQNNPVEGQQVIATHPDFPDFKIEENKKYCKKDEEYCKIDKELEKDEYKYIYNSELNNLSTKTMEELWIIVKDKCTSLKTDGVLDDTKTNVLNNIIVKSNNPKNRLIQYIFENCTDTDNCSTHKNEQTCLEGGCRWDKDEGVCSSFRSEGSTCFSSGTKENCKYKIECNDGYNFKKFNNVSIENDSTDNILQITSCSPDIEFNGECIKDENGCRITPIIRERYDIPNSIKKCNSLNCGLELFCKKKKYEDGNGIEIN